MLTVADTAWRIVGAADYNGDGLTDLYWQRTTDGALAGWRMNGATRLAVDSVVPGTMASPWVVRAVADINRDGHPNFWIRNTGENKVGAWLLAWNGASLVLLDGHVTTPQLGIGYEWAIVGGR